MALEALLQLPWPPLASRSTGRGCGAGRGPKPALDAGGEADQPVPASLGTVAIGIEACAASGKSVGRVGPGGRPWPGWAQQGLPGPWEASTQGPQLGPPAAAPMGFWGQGVSWPDPHCPLCRGPQGSLACNLSVRGPEDICWFLAFSWGSARVAEGPSPPDLLLPDASAQTPSLRNSGLAPAFLPALSSTALFLPCSPGEAPHTSVH